MSRFDARGLRPFTPCTLRVGSGSARPALASLVVARLVLVSLVATAVGCGEASPPDRVEVEVEREADRWLGADRVATFEGHVEHVASIASISDAGLARLGTTWESELAPVEQLYRDAVTKSDVYYALLALKNSLHDGHALLGLDALAPGGPPVRLPWRIRVEYEGEAARYVVREAPDATVDSLPVDSVVVAVDDVPIESLERAHRLWFAGGSSPEGLREDLARWLVVRDPRTEPSPAPGEVALVRVRASDGVERSIALPWEPEATDPFPCPPYAERCAPDADGDYAVDPSFEGLGACVYTTDAADTRVVRYRTLLTPDTLDPTERACLEEKLPHLTYRLDLDEADVLGPRGLLVRDQAELLDHLARAGARRVLFDVRENRGGDFDPVFFGAFTAGSYEQPLKSFVFGPYFRAAPERVAEANPYVALLSGEPIDGAAERIAQSLRDRPDLERSDPLPFYCQTRACEASEATLTSQSNIVFRAAVLTGPGCFSACDDFVALFSDNAIAPTIGLPTAAGDAPYSMFTSLPLADGSEAELRLTVGVSFHPGTDVPLEGHPVAIDVPLAPTASNRGGMVDAALALVPW